MPNVPAAGELELVQRDGLGELLHQGAELGELAGDRLVGGAGLFGGAVGDLVALALQRGGPAAQLGHLAGEVAGAAGQVGDLAADVGAVAQPRGDGVVDRKPGQHRDRDDHRFGGVQAGQQIERGAGADAAISTMQKTTNMAPRRNIDASPARQQ